MISIFKKYKINFSFIIMLTLFVSISELSIMFLLPQLYNVSVGNDVSSILQNMQIDTNIKIIIFMAMLLYLKNFIAIISLRYQCSFIYKVKKDLTEILLNNYLNTDYSTLRSLNISEIQNNVNNETEIFCARTLNSLINFIVDIILSLTIIIALLVYKPLITVSILIIFSIFIISYYLITNKFIKRIGSIRKDASEDLFHNINQIFTNLRIFKLYNLKNRFVSLYSDIFKRHAKMSSTQITLEQSTRYYLDTIFFSSFLVLLLFIDLNSSQFYSSALVFLYAGYRVLPISNRIIISLQSINYTSAIVDILTSSLKNRINDESHQNNIEIDEVNNIELVNIKHKNIKISNISLKLYSGKKYLIKGESGIGKSTLVDIMAGLLKPEFGFVKYNDQDIDGIKNVQDKISYCDQSSTLFNLSVYDNITIGNKDRNSNTIGKIVSSLSIDKVHINQENILEYEIKESGKNLSGGQKQRISIARTLHRMSDILIFDEPTSALDKTNEKKVIEYILSTCKGKIVIFISHTNNYDNLFDEIINLDLYEK